MMAMTLEEAIKIARELVEERRGKERRMDHPVNRMAVQCQGARFGREADALELLIKLAGATK